VGGCEPPPGSRWAAPPLPASSNERLAAAIALLERSAGCCGPSPFAASAAAALLPHSLPLADALPWVARVLPAGAHALRDGAVRRALHNFAWVDAHRALSARQARAVVVEKNKTRCAACEKPIGDAVFGALPGGRGLAHLHCTRELLALSGAGAGGAVAGGAEGGAGSRGGKKATSLALFAVPAEARRL
jgi:hypothetical protein